MSTQPLSPTPEPEHVLYVVLHGLVCLVDVGKAGFIAHVLDMGHEHDYLCGSWLQEEEIPKRAKGQDPFRAWVVGVEPGFAELDPARNSIVELPEPPLDTHPSIRAVFHLPRPRQIYQFISGLVTLGALSSVDQLIGKTAPKSMSSIRVFEYTFKKSEEDAGAIRVALSARDGSVLWEPDALALIKEKTRDVVVLHIYSEPGREPADGAKHNVAEFAKSADFLGVHLALNTPISTKLDLDKDSVPGLLGGEKDFLSERKASIRLLLLNVRSGKDSRQVGGTSGNVCDGTHAKCTGC